MIRNTNNSRIRLPCGFCKKQLSRFPSQIRGKPWGIFCNKGCLGLFNSKRKGTISARFKTGSKKDRKYILVMAGWHPKKNDRGYVYLHRLIVEARLGRFLTDNEIVHHKDEDPENNRWDNLEIMTQSEHARIHMAKYQKEIRNAKN